MRIAVECKSPLLQKSLEIFLSKYISSKKQCDILIRDEQFLDDERCFYIASSQSADLVKPFSKSQLILALQNRYKSSHKDEYEVSNQDTTLDFDILEKRIDFLTQEYKNNILKAVRAFYEK
jgi:hypothetical protein